MARQFNIREPRQEGASPRLAARKEARNSVNSFQPCTRCSAPENPPLMDATCLFHSPCSTGIPGPRRRYIIDLRHANVFLLKWYIPRGHPWDRVKWIYEIVTWEHEWAFPNSLKGVIGVSPLIYISWEKLRFVQYFSKMTWDIIVDVFIKSMHPVVINWTWTLADRRLKFRRHAGSFPEALSRTGYHYRTWKNIYTNIGQAILNNHLRSLHTHLHLPPFVSP